MTSKTIKHFETELKMRILSGGLTPQTIMTAFRNILSHGELHEEMGLLVDADDFANAYNKLDELIVLLRKLES